MPHYTAGVFILLPQLTLLHCTLCVHIGLCLITLPPFLHCFLHLFIQVLQDTLLHCTLCVHIGLCLITLPPFLHCFLHLFIQVLQDTLLHCTLCVYIGSFLIILPSLLYCCHGILCYIAYCLLPDYTLLQCKLYVYIEVCFITLLPTYTATIFLLLPQQTLLNFTLCVYIRLCLTTHCRLFILPPQHTL